MKGKNLVLLLFAVSFWGCEKIIDLDLPTGYKRLVVEGVITDRPGPYVISLTKTRDYSLIHSDTVLYEKGAQVVIKDDAGNTALLKETKPGYYQTDSNDIRGIIGRIYTLSIVTKDGKTYVSKPELLKAVPEIDSIFYEVDESNTDEEGNPADYIYVSFQDPPGERNYYQWHHFLDGKFYSNLDFISDKFFNGKYVTGFRISNGNIPSSFLFKTQQRSLSKEAFEFWTLVKGVTEDTGGPYDPPPAPVIGNVSNVNDPKDYALGFFGASAVTEATIVVKWNKK
jgi:hypothetical protein